MHPIGKHACSTGRQVKKLVGHSDHLNEFEKGDALIRIFHRIDPDELDDETWTKRSGEALFVMKTWADILLGKMMPEK